MKDKTDGMQREAPFQGMGAVESREGGWGHSSSVPLAKSGVATGRAGANGPGPEGMAGQEEVTRAG